MNGALAKGVPKETDSRLLSWHHFRMKKHELTARQLSAVPCPTCGVAVGQRCILASGTLRSEPHVDRKLSAIEAIEKNLR